MTDAEAGAEAALRARLGKGARFDSPAAPAETLRWARRGTAYFARQLNALSNDGLAEPALVAGWSRAHVVAFASYQAREMALLVETVTEGQVPDEAVEAVGDVALAATLPPQALRNLFSHSEVHLNVGWRDLTEAGWAAAPDLDGRPLPLRETPLRRAQAIWLAAVALGNGGSLRDCPGALVQTMLENSARAFKDGVGLAPDAAARNWRIETAGTGGAFAQGLPADLLRWLCFSDERGVTLSPGLVPATFLARPLLPGALT